MSVAEEGRDSRKLPFLVFIVVFVVGFFCLKALTNPIRDRGDERRAWRERFPKHTEQEIERFLHVIADSLLTREKHLCRLRPDDTAAALTQEWLCGDGLDIVELIMDIEREYGLELPESFHERDRTLGDVFAYVTEHSDARPVSSSSENPDMEGRRCS
jgi:acyl carrier protein